MYPAVRHVVFERDFGDLVFDLQRTLEELEAEGPFRFVQVVDSPRLARFAMLHGTDEDMGTISVELVRHNQTILFFYAPVFPPLREPTLEEQLSIQNGKSEREIRDGIRAEWENEILPKYAWSLRVMKTYIDIILMYLDDRQKFIDEAVSPVVNCVETEGREGQRRAASGRPRNEDDDWAWKQVYEEKRPRLDVRTEWQERNRIAERILYDEDSSWRKVLSPNRMKREKSD